MWKKLWNFLFHGKKAEEPKVHAEPQIQTEPKPQAEPKPEPAAPKPPQNPLGNGFYWEFDEVPNGYGGYKTVDVYLRKVNDPSFCRCIVNGEGEIQQFPGFQNDAWKAEMEFPVDHKVRFVFWISHYHEGKAPVRWTLQPDGRYFADDDGYGAENCEEIEMYSFLDEEGRFTQPFFTKKE